MSVAFDASSESHTGTTGSTSQASFTWNHAGGGSARGALVFVFSALNATHYVTSVTYGGTTMTAVPYDASTSSAEAGACRAFYLDNCGTGTKAVVVNRTNNTTIMYAVCFTVTAAGATEIYNAGVMTQGGTTSNTGASSSGSSSTAAAGLKSVDDGSPGSNSLRFMGQFYGGNNVLAAGSGSTAGPSIDFGAYVTDSYYETTAGQGARNVGSASGTDDLALVALAVREVPVDNRNVNLTTTGAGVATETGQKAAQLVQAVTGAGATVPVWIGAHVATPTLSGAGAATMVDVGGRIGAAALTGAGSATVTGSVAEVHSGDLICSGAGSATDIGTKQGLTAQVLSGAGSAPLTETKGGQLAQVLTGAGAVAWSAEAIEYHSGSLTATGAGSVAASVAAARLGAALLSGGGVLAVLPTTERPLEAALTGAGTANVDAATWEPGLEEHEGSAVLTGAGTLTWAALADHARILGLTGAGASSMTAQTARAGLAMLTGAGSVVTIGQVGAPPLGVAARMRPHWASDTGRPQIIDGRRVP